VRDLQLRKYWLPRPKPVPVIGLSQQLSVSTSAGEEATSGVAYSNGCRTGVLDGEMSKAKAMTRL